MSLEHDLSALVREAVAAELAPLLERIDRLEAGRRVLTVAEAAQVLGMSARTVRRLVADGTLPTVDLGGRVTRIPGWALEQAQPRLRSVRGAA
jgi:excisionase family DNA binding protein